MAAGDIPGAVACVTNQIVDTVAVHGTPAQGRTRLERYRGLVDWIELVAPLGHLPGVTRAHVEPKLTTFGGGA